MFLSLENFHLVFTNGYDVNWVSGFGLVCIGIYQHKGNVVDAHDPWQDWFNTNFSSDLVDANTSTSIDLCFDGLLWFG